MGVRVVVVFGTGREADARRLALAEIAKGLLSRGGARLILERDGSMARGDRQQLAQLFAGIARPPTYDHLRAREEPALWISDAVAWCYQRGGMWPGLCEPIVTELHEIRIAK